jgi:hypothetical protein
MLDIVNTAVYASLMIHGTPLRNPVLSVSDSTWIDVASPNADGHWIPAEGEAAVQIVEYPCRVGVDPARVMAISPFRDTARQLRRLLASRYPQLVQGTVHTAQGQGGRHRAVHPRRRSDQTGARRWAAPRPNLFNVAVSRAKQRLYVIGNDDNSAKLPFFSTLASAVPVRRPRTSSGSAAHRPSPW